MIQTTSDNKNDFVNVSMFQIFLSLGTNLSQMNPLSSPLVAFTAMENNKENQQFVSTNNIPQNIGNPEVRYVPQ